MIGNLGKREGSTSLRWVSAAGGAGDCAGCSSQRGSRRGSADLFNQRIPASAEGTLAEVLRRLSATLVANILGLDFRHGCPEYNAVDLYYIFPQNCRILEGNFGANPDFASGQGRFPLRNVQFCLRTRDSCGAGKMPTPQKADHSRGLLS